MATSSAEASSDSAPTPDEAPPTPDDAAPAQDGAPPEQDEAAPGQDEGAPEQDEAPLAPAPAPPPVTTRSGDWAHAITLYVSNIPLRETEAEVQKLFEPFGKVLKVYFKRDRGSLEFQGTAFVAMESHHAGRAAIDQLNGAAYKDVKLRVEESRRPYDPNYRRPRHGRSPRRSDRSPPPYRRSPPPLRRRRDSDSDDDSYRRREVRRRPPEREVPTYEYSRERGPYESRQSSRRQERRLHDSDSDR